MTTPLQSAGVYADLQGLNTLRHGTTEENSAESLRFVAEQFEAIFLQMMLKSAHGEGDEEGLFDNQQTEFYQDWHDKQLSIDLAAGKGVGIAEMLIKQLQTGQSTPEASIPNTAIHSDRPSPVFPVVRPVPLTDGAIPRVDARDKVSLSEEVVLGTPQAFVEHLWPLARAAAEKLGVAPEVILAQAALETGWGKKVNRDRSGASSHNLFNIKADARWSGETASVSTLEYRDGIAVRERANFRAYESFAESFADYVNFMQQSPRYQAALEVAADAEAFTQQLSQAGYATDPHYANKIMRIAGGDDLQQALRSVKI
ncbi:MAG: flagellar assembly peptidoglycan hydrolase FlgJ [Gammaproteobacteria bacterium]|nr:flagellar assembly peptidoglycan hydrolase FlgJ [Gammaproteobacteria bacterium]